MLPLVIFFFIDARFLFFWFCERNINITLEVWQYFLRGKLKCDFSWKTERRRKKAVLYISKFTIKKSYEASQRLPLTALLLYQEIDGIPLFVYLIALFCFFMSFFFWFWGFSQCFFFKHPTVIYIQVSSFEKMLFY